MKSLLIGLGLAFIATGASAELHGRFIEGAPKDRFVIENKGKCALGPADFVIDLNGSAGELIFDVTASGRGVEVFQPFELVAGRDVVGALPVVRDGDRLVSLPVSGLAPGQSVAFTIDVDDTIGQREITVKGAEIAGASLRMTREGAEFSAPFSSNANAMLDYSTCAS